MSSGQLLLEETSLNSSSRNTHYVCRSLLQKAVRRGDAALTMRIADHLRSTGNMQWLKHRTAIIVIEECWPLGVELEMIHSQKDSILTQAARAAKFKDAAGLGTLGYTLAQGDRSVLSGSAEDRAIKIIAAAVVRPRDFWSWVSGQCRSTRQRALVEATRQAYGNGGWLWDRTFMQAAAYLAITADVPEVDLAQSNKPIPLWIAFDKHTPSGRIIFRKLASKFNAPIEHIMWSSFYFEGAVVNELSPSSWWMKEIHWRLRRIGLDMDLARSLWRRARPVLEHLLDDQAVALQAHLCQENDPQLGLLSHEVQ